MADSTYDPDFKKIGGWQRLPKATRDAYIKHPGCPKNQVLFYCFQVWDEKSAHGYGGENAPIRQKDIVEATGIERGNLNHLLDQMAAEGMIYLRSDGRIFPPDKPELKRPKAEPQAEADRKFWAERDPAGYAAWIVKWEAAELERNNLRKIERDTLKQLKEDAAKPGANFAQTLPKPWPTVGPTTPSLLSRTVDIDIDKVSECSPLVEERGQVNASLTHHFGFELPAKDPILEEFVQLAKTLNLPIERLGEWMQAKAYAKHRQRYEVTSAGAVLDWARDELETWANTWTRTRRAPPPAAPPPPEPAIEQRIQTTIEFCAAFPNHPQYAEVAAELRQLEADHPEIAERVRERLARARGAAS